MILIVLPTLLYIGGKEEGNEFFIGGVTWQSFPSTVWEQLVGFAMIIGLFGLADLKNTRGEKDGLNEI